MGPEGVGYGWDGSVAPRKVLNWLGRRALLSSTCLTSYNSYIRGGFSKGGSVESSVTPKETKNIQGYWAQQYV